MPPQRHTEYLKFHELDVLKQTMKPIVTKLLDWLTHHKVYLQLKEYIGFALQYVHGTIANFPGTIMPGTDQMILGSWIVSHASTVVSVLVIFYELVMGRVIDDWIYKTAVISSILTYLLVISYQISMTSTDHWRSNDNEVPLLTIIKSENFYLLATSVIIYNSTPNVFKLLPLSLYSFLNIYISCLEDLFSDTLIARVLLVSVSTFEEMILGTTSMVECLLVSIYFYYFIIYHDYSLLSYIFVLVLRLDTSSQLRGSVVQLLGLLRRAERVLVSDTHANHYYDWIEDLIAPSDNKSGTVKCQRKRNKNRIASLNFDNIQIVNDI